MDPGRRVQARHAALGDAIAVIGPVQRAVARRHSVERRRARGPPAQSLTPPGASPPFRRGCASATSSVGGRTRARNAEPSAARVSAADRSWSRSTHDGQARPGHPVRRGALLATADVRPSLPPVRPGGGAPCRDRTHRGARDWQRMGGWKGASVADGPGGPRRRCWPGHGISRGSSNRGARCPSDRRSVAGG